MKLPLPRGAKALSIGPVAVGKRDFTTVHDSGARF